MQHAGIGLRQPHYAELLASAPVPALGFVEVHSENFFADGGAALGVLDAARARWPLSLHGVGLGLGSATGIDAWHLDRLARLVERSDPVRISDHACFARAALPGHAAVVHGSDLLPLAFTDAALDLLVANVQGVQERLQRPIGVENLSAYLHWADDSMPEPDFFNALTRRSGCWLLLDLNNLIVNALNEHLVDEAAALRAGCAWVDAIDAASVGEIHLAGYHSTGDTDDIVIDDHGSRVQPPVWALFQHALRRLGPRPTLIEWDSNLPSPEVLLAEAAQAERWLQLSAR
jgi:uncharacterized protein (UPF0276 family)